MKLFFHRKIITISRILSYVTIYITPKDHLRTTSPKTGLGKNRAV